MTVEAEVRIVEARAEHAPFVAWVTLTAFRSHLEKGFWDFMLEEEDEAGKLHYLEALATTEQLHWAHYSPFIVAEVNGTPAAALCGYFQEELGGAAIQTAGIEANARTGRSEEQAAEGFARAMSVMNVIPEHVAGTWIVENVATLPEFRRRGLVDRLVGEMLERGRGKGASTADISVFIGNDAAQRAYEKCGFEAIAEKRDAGFESVYGTPGIRTLRRAI
ncbi:MAG: GNAT family N-acetyltransferase [Chloroflexi bacterium]|nr:GNAT family N-acetyltransferase [Chloroflexota bacterium]